MIRPHLHFRREAVLCALLAFSGGCALPTLMPPLDRSYLQSGSVAAPPSSWRGSTEPPRPDAPRTTAPKPPTVEHDSAEDLTRVSIVTHHGKYFLWMQQPQVTFFYVYAGDIPPVEPPAVVYLVFRTQSPQSIHDNKLTLVCDGIPAQLPGLPTSRVDQNYQLSSHFLTFSVPLTTFLEFAACRTAEVEVGGVNAPFTEQQLLNLEGFAASIPRMRT